MILSKVKDGTAVTSSSVRADMLLMEYMQRERRERSEQGCYLEKTRPFTKTMAHRDVKIGRDEEEGQISVCTKNCSDQREYTRERVTCGKR